VKQYILHGGGGIIYNWEIYLSKEVYPHCNFMCLKILFLILQPLKNVITIFSSQTIQKEVTRPDVACGPVCQLLQQAHFIYILRTVPHRHGDPATLLNRCLYPSRGWTQTAPERSLSLDVLFPVLVLFWNDKQCFNELPCTYSESLYPTGFNPTGE